MSRLGKKAIALPNGVTIEHNTDKISVKGPKGHLELCVPHHVGVDLNGSLLNINVSDSIGIRDYHRELGLYRALINNMVVGVSSGFKKELELVGVGYRVQLVGKHLQLLLGYSHDIKFDPPKGIEFKVEGQNKISVSGIDKHLVGQVAANIRFLRRPDAYKGKGIRYANELVKTKPGKSVKK